MAVNPEKDRRVGPEDRLRAAPEDRDVEVELFGRGISRMFFPGGPGPQAGALPPRPQAPEGAPHGQGG
jgi:hypothetical protein